MTFAVTLPVRFGDCDAAGIGYYPRLLALVDAAIEDWTAATLGIARRALHSELARGLPTVTLTSDFAAACHMGEALTLTVRLTRLGTGSINLAVAAAVDGAPRFTVALVQALIDTSSGRAVPWPEDWRGRLQAVLTAPAG